MDSSKITPASDEDRQRAEAKKLVLAPLHDSIAPDEEPEAVTVSRHISDGPVGNIETDCEDSSSLVGFSNALNRQAVTRKIPARKPTTEKMFRLTPESIVMLLFVATAITATALYVMV